MHGVCARNLTATAPGARVEKPGVGDLSGRAWSRHALPRARSGGDCAAAALRGVRIVKTQSRSQRSDEYRGSVRGRAPVIGEGRQREDGHVSRGAAPQVPLPGRGTSRTPQQFGPGSSANGEAATARAKRPWLPPGTPQPMLGGRMRSGPCDGHQGCRNRWRRGLAGNRAGRAQGLHQRLPRLQAARSATAPDAQATPDVHGVRYLPVVMAALVRHLRERSRCRG
jgi:hypothetical protein